VIGTVLLGLATMWSEGSSIFGLFQVPKMPGTDKALAHQIFGWHALAANAVLIVAGLHAAAALGHHYVLRDAVLARMVPFVRRGPTPRDLGGAATPGE
jgi:cytochrome b561